MRADNNSDDKKGLGTGFNDQLSPTAGSGIDVENFKVKKEADGFSTVVETVNEPKFDEFKPPQTVEFVNTKQNKIPIPVPISLDPKKNFVPQKKGVNKALLFIAAALVLILLILVIVSRFKGGGEVNDLGNKGEITWWGLTYEESDLSDLISEFEEKNGVDVVYRKQSTENYRERLTSSLASGKGPDIFEFHNSWPVTFKNELSAMPNSVMSQEDFSKTYYPIIVSDLTIEGKGVVGLPLEFDALTLFINESFFSAATKDPPTTWDEARETAMLFAQLDESKNLLQAGIPLGKTKNVDFWPDIIALMLMQSGANIQDPVADRTLSVIQFYKQFGEDDNVWSEGFPKSTLAFAREQVPMYIGPSRKAVDIARINSNLRFITVDMLQVARDDPNSPDFSYATYWAEGVWDRSSDKEDAWKLLTFLSSKESLEQINSNVKKRVGVVRPYPRIDMRDLLIKDPIVGSVVKLAPFSKSWYLHDETYDGETGINSQFAAVYSPMINSSDRLIGSYLDEKTAEMNAVLRTFGLDRN